MKIFGWILKYSENIKFILESEKFSKFWNPTEYFKFRAKKNTRVKNKLNTS